MRAYQAFALGQRAYLESEKPTLYRRALNIDANFVEAWKSLSVSYGNLGNEREARDSIREAYERSRSIAEPLKLEIEDGYRDAVYQFQAGIELMKRKLALYPFDARAANKIAWYYEAAFEDQGSAEPYFKKAHSIDKGTVHMTNLCWNQAALGKPRSIERLISEAESLGLASEDVFTCKLYLAVALSDPGEILKLADQFESRGQVSKIWAMGFRLGALLTMGRLSDADTAAGDFRREAQLEGWLDFRDIATLVQAWREFRHTGKLNADTQEKIGTAIGDPLTLDCLAPFSVHVGYPEPLVQFIDSYENEDDLSDSVFVQDQIQFARGSLAFIRGDGEKARDLIAPIARDSLKIQRHHILARIYDDLGLWPEAISEYERALSTPQEAMWPHRHLYNPAEHALDQFRLAQAHDRLGDVVSARRWYEQFTEDWKDADPDIPELIEARERLAELKEAEAAVK